ncbi:threonine synthase [Frateuria soli]|uniref:threonine synthase n=1 Tax=Frateuria soli TaxID=1542730 RepID=UPI001E53CCB1|nr:threonine synthase [Frateuria soli]UGB37959.1 threonine synthase [Frateuria soli]
MSELRYPSTRGQAPAATLSEAIAAGLAPDGGLYVPERLPSIQSAAFDPDGDLAATATTLLAPFFAGDPLGDALPAICAEAFTFEAPLHPLARPDASLLELFHGPTAAFKDFGARFLAACLRRLRAPDARPLTILVATSGDTGAAVGAAFHRQPGVRVAILYPDGRVSPRQAHQLGCFGDNVHALRVAGSFDDCQRMVRAALNDSRLQAHVPLSSANSISLGRLLPQMAYYAHAALQVQRAHGVPLDLIVPTGNLGNATAAVWTRAIGLPIGRIMLACNANATLPEFFAGAAYRPRAAVPTLANAMDVGAPSNFERIRWTCRGDAALREAVTAASVDDQVIRTTLLAHASAHGELLCPHTATAMHLLDREPVHTQGHWAVVATAHPAKFEQVLEPLLGRAVPVPPTLAGMLARASRAEPLAADPVALAAWLAR